MKRTSGLHEWANERFNGELDPQLIAWREAGLSIDDIAHELRDRGLVVSRETVRRWVKSLESETAA